MTTPKKTEGGKGSSGGSDQPSAPTIQVALRPFQEAAEKLARATHAAQESAMQANARACLDFNEEIRKQEQEAWKALTAANRKFMETMGRSIQLAPEEQYAARMQAQMEHANEVRKIHLEAQTKVASVVSKASGDERPDPVAELVERRQSAYQAYLQDLQRAWSDQKSLDADAMSAIAVTILSTVNTLCR